MINTVQTLEFTADNDAEYQFLLTRVNDYVVSLGLEEGLVSREDQDIPQKVILILQRDTESEKF